MKDLSKIFLCAGLGAMFSISASAYNLVSPQVGEVTKVKSLGTIKLQWDAEVMEPPTDATVDLLDADGKKVADGSCNFDWDVADGYEVTFSPTITTPGTYTAVIPANMADDNQNPEYKLTYEIEAADPNINGAMPTAYNPVSGSAIVQGDGVEFNSIRLDFANAASITLNEANISFTNQAGTPISYTVMGWYKADDPMLQYAKNPFITFNFNDNGDMPSGTYTLSIKPGAFTAPDGKINEETIDCVYTYTKTKAEVDDTPLEIIEALMGGVTATDFDAATATYKYNWIGTNAVAVTKDMEVAEFIGIASVKDGEEATGFLVSFNHGGKSDYVRYDFIDVEENTIIRTSRCIKQDDGSFLLPWSSTTKLVDGKKYSLEFHAYDNIENQVEFGNGAALTFIGIAEGFKFSSAEFVTVVPSPGETLGSLDQNKLTVLFTEPVKAKAVVNLGFGMSSSAECVSAKETETGRPVEYDNVWYVYIPESIMTSYPLVDVTVSAVGQDGRVVAGDSGFETTAGNMVSYKLTLCQPRILVNQTNSHVAELSTFSVYSADGRGINGSYNDYPYVVDAKGNKVAEINKEYYTNETGDKTAYKPLGWTNETADADPTEIEFQMVPAITKKGQYTLVFPDATFNIGNQFDSDISAPQQYDYYVTDFFPVTYTTDNNTVALSPVEITKKVDLFIKTNENWKLETLTLNGEDVTENVTDGRYQSEAASEAMNFVATFAYDGIVLTPSGVDDVVSDLNLRGWSEGGNLYVAGLKDGQVINIYTTGGSLMASATVADGNDTMGFDVEAGVYIITVTEGSNTVALKLVNK